MSADEAWTRLNDARDARVAGLEDDLTELGQELNAARSGLGKLAETAGVHEARLTAAENTSRDLRDDLKGVRDGQRTLVMVLVLFAFAVAGSALGLAFALGGTP